MENNLTQDELEFQNVTLIEDKIIDEDEHIQRRNFELYCMDTSLPFIVPESELNKEKELWITPVVAQKASGSCVGQGTDAAFETIVYNGTGEMDFTSALFSYINTKKN